MPTLPKPDKLDVKSAGSSKATAEASAIRSSRVLVVTACVSDSAPHEQNCQEEIIQETGGLTI
jgi:hypothetical protein